MVFHVSRESKKKKKPLTRDQKTAQVGVRINSLTKEVVTLEAGNNQRLLGLASPSLPWTCPFSC